MNRQQRRAIARANAALSTGPVTDAGKATSSQNALTHGLTARKPYFPAEEQDYKAFAAQRIAALRPYDHAEIELAQTIIDLEWRLQRVPILEARLQANEEADPIQVTRSLDILSRHELRLRKQLQAVTADFYTAVLDRRNRQAVIDFPRNRAEIGFVLKHANPLSFKAFSADLDKQVKELAAAASAPCSTAGTSD